MEILNPIDHPKTEQRIESISSVFGDMVSPEAEIRRSSLKYIRNRKLKKIMKPGDTFEAV